VLQESFVVEAGVKIFNPLDLILTFQQHKDLTRKQFEEFAAYVKTHSLDTTETLLDHLHANKLVRFIHQAARHTDMTADAKTLYGATSDDIVENLALKPSPARWHNRALPNHVYVATHKVEDAPRVRNYPRSSSQV